MITLVCRSAPLSLPTPADVIREVVGGPAPAMSIKTVCTGSQRVCTVALDAANQPISHRAGELSGRYR
jgi:hypothetical protein